MPKTNSNKNIVGWNSINWRKIQKAVFKLQKRIYQASQRGDTRQVRKLQKTLLRSHNAKLLSVRKVTQDNIGKKTAGIDKIHTLSPSERLELAEQLQLKDKAKPVRRVWIPKANGEKRPLGIPTIYDRAMQALVKAALEPEWETRFEENSYGFRPGRSCHDAIGAIFNSIRYKPKFVLDTDINKCFDNINHEALLQKLDTYPKLRKQIKAWLKAEIQVGKELFPTDAGTPQGGVCSPLLANIALHEVDVSVKTQIKGVTLIRYADDLVVIHEDLKGILLAKRIIEERLFGYRLELNKSKTRIVHTLHEHEGNKPGFDFLGFNVRQYKVGKYQSGKNTNGKLLGFKTIIKPSKEKVLQHYRELATIIDRHKSATQKALIGNLNPIIRGWSNYYRAVCSKETYSKLSQLLTLKLMKWGYSRHPNKSKNWVNNKYWHTIGNRKWNFAAKKKESYIKLYNHPETAITRHAKVKGRASPYNGDANYWASRMGSHPELPKRISRLLKHQKGKCNYCGLTLDDESIMEIDHILPLSLGGKNTRDNLQLIHRHCHHVKSAKDGSKTGTHREPKLRGAG